MSGMRGGGRKERKEKEKERVGRERETDASSLYNPCFLDIQFFRNENFLNVSSSLVCTSKANVKLLHGCPTSFYKCTHTQSRSNLPQSGKKSHSIDNTIASGTNRHCSNSRPNKPDSNSTRRVIKRLGH